MSGSRNKFSRNGSTDCSESGPPSWNNTIPTRFFPAKLFAPIQRILHPLDFRPQRRRAPRYCQVIHEENPPADQVRRKHAVEILHAASSSRLTISASPRIFSSPYRSISSSASSACIAKIEKKKIFSIVGSSPDPGPPISTGWGCCVRHQRIDPYTSGTSKNEKIPNSALSSARRSGSSINVRSSRKAMYNNHSTNAEVSRASHVHQIPHAGCAQIGPVT